MRTTLEASPDSPSRERSGRAPGRSQAEFSTRLLEPDALGDHIDQLYRAAWAMCGSRHDAEDLVQETFANVLKRPRFLRDGNAVGYLMRALRNTYASGYRRAASRPASRELFEDDVPADHQSPLRCPGDHACDRKRAAALQRSCHRRRPPRHVLSRSRTLTRNPRDDAHDAPSPRTAARGAPAHHRSVNTAPRDVNPRPKDPT